jgi:hypothetical protein
MDCALKREPSFLRGAIVGEIARLCCTTVVLVEADMPAIPVAKD